MILILKSRSRLSSNTQLFKSILEEKLEKRHVEFFLSNFEQLEAYIEKGRTQIFISEKKLENFSTVFIRKSGPYFGANALVAREVKRHGNLFVDTFQSHGNSPKKLLQMYSFSLANIPIPKTYFSPQYNTRHLLRAIEYLGFPLIVKQCDSSRGNGVALVKNLSELELAITSFRKIRTRKEILLQEFIPNEFEYRIFVTGSTVAVVEKKTRHANEFRNNVHLGAKEEFLNPNEIDPLIKDLSLRAADLSEIQVAGVDVIKKSNGEFIIFEVNHCPAFTLQDEASDEMEKLSDYLVSCEKNQSLS